MAVSQSITKKFTQNVKSVDYLAKNFTEFRQNLINFAKAYYPNTYTDFNEASPGMMFIEMASYVGDVLSFYIDNQFKQNLLLQATERDNVVIMAQSLGYKPRQTSAATVTATIFQVVPAVSINTLYEPDSKFFLRILKNSTFSSNTQPRQTFYSTEDVDFSDSLDRTVRVFSRNNVTNVPTTFVISKPIKLIAAQEKTITFTFGDPKKFTRVEIPDSNFINIQKVVDSNGNEWSEVDYLGQDLVIEEKDVTRRDSSGYLTSETLPTESAPPSKVITFVKKSRRFVTRINKNFKTELWFGSGTAADDEIVTLNANQIANTKYNQRIANTSLDVADFINTDTFGLAPANTTLTVTYLVGGGLESNVPSGTIINTENVIIQNRPEDYDPLDLNTFNGLVVQSVSILNNEPATGGGSVETIEEIRQNALAFFNAQNRAVTANDYTVRALAMPGKYGSVAKAFVVRDEQLNSIGRSDSATLQSNLDANPYNNTRYVENPINPNTINLYVLGYDANKKLTNLNSLVKNNLAKYLEQYRILTDDIKILDAFVVNIGVEFDIIVYKNYNMNDVLARCIDAVKQFFNIDNWQINQPIILNDLYLAIGSIDGVQNVDDIRITNKYRFKDGKEYQEIRYPIDEAQIDNIIYPSLDPCVFEIKYPETDIIGNARQ